MKRIFRVGGSRVCGAHLRFIDRRESNRRLPGLAILECGDKALGAGLALAVWVGMMARRVVRAVRFD